MILNLSYDTSVGSAPIGFTATLDRIVSFFQSTFLDPVTVNIAVGYGEVNGQALFAGALGESSTAIRGYTYAQIKSAFAADAKSSADAGVVASLPAIDPTGGHYWVASAEAKALGLSTSTTSFDGAVGFSTSYGFDYDNSNGVTPGQFDFFGVVAHELSEIMGRQLLVGQTVGSTANGYEPMDLLHFASPGVRAFTGAQPGYFSADNGVTNLNNFNTNSGGDFGDWASSAGADSFLAFSASGVVAAITPNDVKVMDALGWDITSSPPPDTIAPVLSSTSPADNATNVAAASNLVLTFSESVKAGSGNLIIRNAADGSAVATIAIGDISQVGFSGASVTINPTSDLAAGTHYYVTLVSGAIQDLAGNAYAGISSSTAFDFTTATPLPAHVAYDFNGDIHSDLLLQNNSGQIGVWLMNGTSPLGALANAGPNPGVSAHVKASADFNGDGKSDILLQNDSGWASVWLMNGARQISKTNIGTNLGPSWHVKDTGDFNGDGKSDIVWQHDNGRVSVWLMNGTSVVSQTALGTNPGKAVHIDGVGDFNGDGKSDILLQNDNGQASLWLMNGASILSNINAGANPGTSWHAKGAADFNGDGKSDILWQNDSGQMQLWLMNGGTVVGTGNVGTADPSWHVKGAEDFNGDGRADIVTQNDSGQVGVWLMNGTTVLAHDTLMDNPGTAWHVDWA